MFDILEFYFFIVKQNSRKMENFEALSNDEIRDRLRKFGLPNIPVTTTTRKLMIKRLVEATSGGGPKPNNKARRETVNVPKQSSADDSESDAEVKRPTSKPKPASASRRATIAATPVLPQPPAVIEKPIKPKPPAAVVAEKTPTPVTPAKKSAPKAIVADIPGQSDDDAVVPPIVKPNRRTSRSPSLGKSTVVTTSYKHTIEPLHEQSVASDDDVILVNNDDCESGVDEFFAKKGKDSAKHFTTSTTSSGDNNVLRRTTLDTFRTTIAPGPTLLSEYRDQAKEAIATNDSLFRRRYTTNTPAKPQRDFNGNGDNENDDPLQKVDTPYLSNFTRRLAQLKAEPLPGLNNTFGFAEPSASSSAAAGTAAAASPTGYRQERDHYRPSFAGRSSMGRSQYARPVFAMAEVPQEPSAWKKLEAKIRWPLFALMALFSCVFIYVFLFTN